MKKTVARPWARSGVILGIVDFLEKNGYDPASIVGKSAMKMVESADAYRHVDMLNIMSIFQKTVDYTNRPDMGLLLGLSVDVTQLGPIGFLFKNAPTVGHALADFVRYGPVFQTQAHFGLRSGKHRVCLEYSSNHPEIPGWEIDSEVTVTYMMGLVNELVGAQTIPDEIHFDHVMICEPSKYHQILSVRPSFNRGVNRLYYPLSILDRPISGANHLLYSVLSHHLSDMANALPKEDDLQDVVRNNIRRGLGTNTSTLEHIASEVGLEPRTLQRHLIKSGTTFQKIFDGVRIDLAFYYLERTSLDVTTIAFELGYAESSIFSRAFKRWTGSAPKQYREKLRWQKIENEQA